MLEALHPTPHPRCTAELFYFAFESVVRANQSLRFSLIDPHEQHKVLEQARMGDTAPHRVACMIEDAVGNAWKAGYGGLVIVVDEFGRFIDQLHNESVKTNLALAQELAELTTRTRGGELHLLVGLHQNFEDYAIGIGGQERIDWSKIQGRFRQIVLSEEPDNLYELLARCITIESSAIVLVEKRDAERVGTREGAAGLQARRQRVAGTTPTSVSAPSLECVLSAASLRSAWSK